MAVAALEIKSCSPFAQGQTFGDVGPYQQLDGTVHFAVDPDHPRNARITDLRRASRDAQGLVRCSADVRLLQPVEPQRSNQRLLLDIVNRGMPTVLTNLNSAVDRQDPGNGFLMRQGYTVVKARHPANNRLRRRPRSESHNRGVCAPPGDLGMKSGPCPCGVRGANVNSHAANSSSMSSTAPPTQPNHRSNRGFQVGLSLAHGISVPHEGQIGVSRATE